MQGQPAWGLLQRRLQKLQSRCSGCRDGSGCSVAGGALAGGVRRSCRCSGCKQSAAQRGVCRSCRCSGCKRSAAQTGVRRSCRCSLCLPREPFPEAAGAVAAGTAGGVVAEAAGGAVAAGGAMAAGGGSRHRGRYYRLGWLQKFKEQSRA